MADLAVACNGHLGPFSGVKVVTGPPGRSRHEPTDRHVGEDIGPAGLDKR